MKRCNYCFDEYESGLEACPYCRYKDGDVAKEPYHLYPGTILNNRYIIGQVLGFGGFGITYMAWDKTLNSVMAIKEYYPSGLVNRVPGTKNVILFSGNRRREYNHGLERFLDEARSMARFKSHKYIINVFEYFEENETAYIVMEYLEGTTLSHYLKNNKLSIDRCVEIIEHVCDALKVVHDNGIVHRDVSPDNIFLCNNNKVKLIDFGAARFGSGQEMQRTIILKPGFAPPEQYEKVNVQGAWTDIYALGATFYYMLTSQKPEESTNRRISDTLVPPHEIDENIPENISNTIMQAMAIDRHIRFAKITDFLKALNQEKPVLTVAKQIKRRKRRRMGGLAAALLLVGMSAVFLFMYIERQRAQTELFETTITMAFSLYGDNDFDSARIDAFSQIIESFRFAYPDVTVEVNYYPHETYEQIISENTPTLFESTILYEPQYAADLRSLANRATRSPVHFINRYSALFPQRDKLPLGFNAPVIFINVTQTGFDEPGFGDRNTLASLDTSHEARQQFIDGEAGVYLSTTADFAYIQRALAGRYRLVYIDTEAPEAEFAELWSINRHATHEERLAAEALLLFMLSDSAQDILHIQNRSGSLPINRNVLEVFGDVHDDFNGFFENIESYVFP